MSIPISLFDEAESPHPVAALEDKTLKQHYISIVALISATDETCSLMQLLMLECLADSLGLSKEHKEQAIKMAADNDKMTEALASWSSHPLRDVLLFDMCRSATVVDGTVCDRDKKSLQILAQKLDISKKKTNAILQIAMALKSCRANRNLAWFDNTLAQAGLDAEQFAFIRSSFTYTSFFPSDKNSSKPDSQVAQKPTGTTQGL